MKPLALSVALVALVAAMPIAPAMAQTQPPSGYSEPCEDDVCKLSRCVHAHKIDDQPEDGRFAAAVRMCPQEWRAIWQACMSAGLDRKVCRKLASDDLFQVLGLIE
jgi:hypothetical protein